MSRVLGMTGTRNPISYEQYVWLHLMVSEECDVLHHGACVGADEESHDAAVAYGQDIIVHPPTNERLMMAREKWRTPLVAAVMPAKDYLDRNRDIVDASEKLIALPDGPERRGSGTWYTINYAVRKGKPVSICYPDGSVESR